MNPTQAIYLSPRQLVSLLATHVKFWGLPALLIALMAAGYACVRRDTWEASQTLIVRNEAVNNGVGPGKFGDANEMKTVQETILELVKSRSVLTAALKEVGPSTDAADKSAWPTPADVDDLREAVKLTPPKGAEFGRTEVFYLQVRDHSQTRAVALAGALCRQLQSHSQQVRDVKAQSMIDELAKTAALAKSDLLESTAQLTAMEKQVGGDLAELRALSENSSGESSLRRMITEISTELRQVEVAQSSTEKVLALLTEAQDDPGRLVATPNALLDSQPSLRRLKEGLVDAQLSTARLLGKMSEEHPLVRAARQSEEEIGRHLHDELAIAIRGLKTELQLHADRQTLLRGQLGEATGRLDRLAGLRATYANQAAETRNRSQLFEEAEQHLAAVRATLASATAASLISPIDTPDTGNQPVGPGRAMIVLLGLAGGLLTGFGVLFLTVPSPQPVEPAPEATAAAPRPSARPRRHVAAPYRGVSSLTGALQKILSESRA